jgi:prokaryotic ubiquitin-like protein Pup
MAQEQVEKQSSKPQEEVEEVQAKDLTNEELNADVDDILGDIDDILEENAEEFVASYVQKGGQ